MVTLWSVFIAVVAVFTAYTVLFPVLLNSGRLNKGFRVMCPERNLFARVEAKVSAAALALTYGAARIPVRSCSLLRPGEDCAGACMKSA